MIPHYCLVMHNPPDTYGDCLRACIATICNIENIGDVPHFAHGVNGPEDGERANELMKAFLLTRGLRPFYVAVPAESATIDEVFEQQKLANADIDYLLFCKCGGADHVVICRNDRVIHNPSLSQSSISGPAMDGLWVIVVLVPISP